MAGTQYRGSEIKGVDQFLEDAEGLDSEREKERMETKKREELKKKAKANHG